MKTRWACCIALFALGSGFALVAAVPYTVKVTYLHPEGAASSSCTAVNGSTQAGTVTFYGGQPHAWLWKGSRDSGLDLHPPGALSSRINALGGSWQVGVVNLTNGESHASAWKGTAASWVDLHPPRSAASLASGTDGQRIVGQFQVGYDDHAALWGGLSPDCRDLHPEEETRSYAAGVAHGQQVGYLERVWPNLMNWWHPVLWYGFSQNFVDLCPDRFLGMEVLGGMAQATTGTKQVGFLDTVLTGPASPSPVACLWSGTAASIVSLHPNGAAGSMAQAAAGEWQAGRVRRGDEWHACLWKGTAESCFDLHPYAAFGYGPGRTSAALALWAEGDRVYVGGEVSGPGSATQAVLWEVAPLIGPTNQPPRLRRMQNQRLYRGHTLTTAASAWDPDGPESLLTFSLVQAPPGMHIDPNAGTIQWTPTESTPPGSYPVTVAVTDDGIPARSDTGSFVVTLQIPRYQVETILLAPDPAQPATVSATTATYQAGRRGNQACLWFGSEQSLTPISPAQSVNSSVLAAFGDQQAGYASFPGSRNHAALWSGTAESWVDLHPSGATNSSALAVWGAQQGGEVDQHAVLWSGTAASRIDLHPAWAIASRVNAVAENEQAGWARFRLAPAAGSASPTVTHAGIWSGLADSWIDLHAGPTGSSSLVFGTTGSQQVGEIGGAAALWAGSPASVVSLQPEGARTSEAHATIDVLQCGKATRTLDDQPRAGIWAGSAESWFDLHSFLGVPAIGSSATSLAHDGTRFYVVGEYSLENTSTSRPVLWILTPVPAPGAPTLTLPPDAELAEGETWTGQATATDPDLGQNLRFSLVSGPTGLSLDPITGAMSWTPQESQAPKNHRITVRVTDDGPSPEETLGVFQIRVTEVNQPPAITVPADFALIRGNSLVLTNLVASDADLPPERLTFSFDQAPAGMTISPTSGRIAWQTLSSHPLGPYPITVRVTDTGSPTLSSTATFHIDLRPSGFSIRRIPLDPPGATLSVATAVWGPRQAGYFRTPGSGDQAVVWEGSRTSWVGLNPPTASDARVLAMDQNCQVGYAHFPGPSGGTRTEAGLWQGTASSWRSLNPAGSLSSYAYATAVLGDQQAGVVGWRGGIWSGSTDSWVDLTPTGYVSAEIHGLAPGQQVGAVWAVRSEEHQAWRAGLWHGTPESFQDLTPPGVDRAEVNATTGTLQAGYADVPIGWGITTSHAALWSGSVESWQDIHPAGARSSRVSGAFGPYQVGEAFVMNPESPSTGRTHAILWKGSADSWLDLQTAAGEPFDLTSVARAVWSDGSVVHVAGQIDVDGKERATLWVLTPLDVGGLQLTGPDDLAIPEGVPARILPTVQSPSLTEGLLYSLPVKPAGMTLDTGTGAMIWTPSEAAGPGTYPVTIEVTDGGSPPLTATRTFHITVTEVNLPPTLAVPGDQSLMVGQNLRVQASATDPDLPANTLVFSLTTPPPGMTINPATGHIAWDPEGNPAVGEWTVTVQVNDQGVPPMQDSRSFRVQVRDSGPPEARPDSIARKAGSGTKVRAVHLTSNDLDPTGFGLTLVSVTTPTAQGGTAAFTSGWVFYDPPSGTDPPSDSFQYRIRDSRGQEVIGLVSVTLAPANSDPSLNLLRVTGGFPHPATVRFAGIPGRVYAVQTSPSLAVPVWTTLGSVVVPTDGIAVIQDPGAVTERIRFYRAIIP